MSKRLRVSTEVISGIYEIVNLNNEYRYVGSSKDIYGRWVQHQNDLRKEKHHNPHLQNAWKLHKEIAFEFRILEKTQRDIQTLFEREQYWYDYYKEKEITLYNASPIAASSSGAATIDDLKNGKRKTSYDQFMAICDMLQNTILPFYQIAEVTNTHVNQVYMIYKREYFADLTKEMVFQMRRNSGEDSAQAKLSKNDVVEIVNKMLEGAYTTDLCIEYNVSQSTIDDIRQHKTWRDITENIIFPHPRKHGNEGKAVMQYDLNGNFIAEYKNAREAARVTGIGYKLISRVCLGQRRQTCGFVFKFATQQNNCNIALND
jgi:group I intron endonuclease